MQNTPYGRLNLPILQKLVSATKITFLDTQYSQLSFKENPIPLPLLSDLKPTALLPPSHKASTMSEGAFKNFRGSKDQKNCPQDRKRVEQLSVKAHPSTAHQANASNGFCWGQLTSSPQSVCRGIGFRRTGFEECRPESLETGHAN